MAEDERLLIPSTVVDFTFLWLQEILQKGYFLPSCYTSGWKRYQRKDREVHFALCFASQSINYKTKHGLNFLNV